VLGPREIVEETRKLAVEAFGVHRGRVADRTAHEPAQQDRKIASDATIPAGRRPRPLMTLKIG